MRKPKRKKKPICPCGKEIHQFCPRCSKLKMCFMLKDPNSNFKVQNANGQRFNPIYYSFLRDDKKPVEVAIANMKARAMKMPEYLHSRMVIFYDREGNKLDTVVV